MPVSNLIFLIGMMGCGKSSIGRELARLLKLDFIDLDNEIVKATGKDINQIFEEEGEASFRKKEAKYLKMFCEKERLVVSTGGGIVLDPSNVEEMRKEGFVIYLSASKETLIKRIQGTTHRPLLRHENWEKILGELLDERNPIYEKVAHIEFNTDHKTALQSATNLYEELLRR
jgi:shikimate kinase